MMVPSVGARVADGRRVAEEGQKEVQLLVGGTIRATVRFRVLQEVTRPLLSVGQLVRRGFTIQLSAHPFLRFRDRRVAVHRDGNFFYLQVRLMQDRAAAPSWSSLCASPLCVLLKVKEKLVQ